MSETTDSKPMLASGPALSMGSLQVSLPAAVQDHLPEKETGARAYPDDSVWIESLNLDAQGVAHRPDGKVVFVDGALPFEQVSASTYRRKSNWEQANLTAIHVESSQRVRPGCPHFGLHAGSCGGCKMQHLHPAAQVAVKQRVLEDNLWHLGKVKPETLLRPIEGPAWGYRYRARLSVRYVIKKGEVLIGFHERKSRYVADMRVCPVLAPHVSAMLLPLRQLVASMDARDTLPQMELACGDDQTAMVLRHLEPLSEADLARLRAFGEAHGMQWWLQSKGPDTVRLLDEASPPLTYALPEFGITMPFKPTDFTQVNPHINRVLVSRALRLLDVQQSERVIDWFCGLGNFTLPLATKAREVLGIEGSAALVARAQENLDSNQALALTHKALAATKFVARNLFEMTPSMLVADGTADKWLVDPPREGALALVTALAHIEQARAAGDKAIGAEAENLVVSGDEGDWKSDAERPVLPEGASNWAPPRRIVYVSCNPATLARDAEVLVHQAGYRCIAAGAINMFPHTAHVESMAVFERDA